MPRSKNGSPATLMLVFLLFISFFTFLQLLCTPVMLPVIGEDLKLNTAQLGLIWGMTTFGGLFFSLPCGLLGDRVGTRWGIFIIATIIAISLGMRGFAKDTASLAVLMFIGGGVVGGLPPLAMKSIFTWFSPSRVGLASGMWASVMGLGMAVGAAVSVTVVATAVHGWQNTFFLYGALLLVFSLVWLAVVREPSTSKASTGVPFREAFTKSIRSRDVWFCIAACFGITGLNMGFVGYLPAYLLNIGWREVTSSLALTVYFLSGVIGGPVLLALSDKVRLRKIFFVTPVLIWIIAIIMMTIANAGTAFWILIIIAGFTYGSLVAMLTLVITETKGIGARYAGTANGISVGIGGTAGLLFATIGGQLALSNAILPFIVEPILCLICIIPFFFTRETGVRNSAIIKEQPISTISPPG